LPKVKVRNAIRCIIYDVGGTLLYPAPPIEELAVFAERAGGFTLPHERLAAALPNIRHFFAQHDRPLASLWASPERLDAAWQAYYATALRDAGVDAPWERLLAVGAHINAWYAHPDRWAVYPDVRDAFAEAKRRGCQQGVVSDWGPDLLPLLHELDLTPSLDLVVASATAGYAKPSPEIFLHATARAGLPPDACLYVGDSYLHDVIGARTAGLHAVLLDREGTAPSLDCPAVRCLEEVWEIVDGMGDAGSSPASRP
jgi:putative hydrolase of the HAD superfamily